MRYFLDISYQGTHYAGWQRQNNAISVQQKLEEALSIYLREEMACTGAGRTDAGVHARQLMVHFDTDKPQDRRLLAGLNGILPKDIAINALYQPTKTPLHARFDASHRAYTYQITNRKNPEYQHFATWVKSKLDVEQMQTAARLLLEYESFASFCKAHSDNLTYLCDIRRAEFEITKDLLLFHIGANRFLRGMVRAVIGTLVWVGTGKLTVDDFRQIIEAQDRKAAGPNAEAKGLFLTEVQYPEGSLERIA
ncbi:MAG: tRNA pseudouridine(38-40) synthase TruA [Bacteroidia bacterium]